MKSFTIAAAALALIAGLTQAAPSKRQFYAAITFEGAADASFEMSVPVDDTVFEITNPLSISHISSNGGAICTFFGIDGSETTVVGATTVDVGPPQTQVSGICDYE